MTKADVQKLLRETGLRPDRAAGQHFLLDETVVERMADLAQVKKNETVLEIGPGFGVLTKTLLRRGAKVIAIELDQRLATFLKSELADEKNATIVQGDVFRVRLDELVSDGKYKLVANVPYSATSGIFRQFLSQAPRPTSMTVLIQREVAQRIVAPPGEMSLLSLSVQYYGRPQLGFSVEPGAFVPIPAVYSAVVHVSDIHPGEASAEKMFRLARMGFAGRRKQLQNSLAAGLHRPATEVADILLKTGIAPEIRPQELSVQNWLTLAKSIS